ncbi:MAG: ABC transporter substrate-binding protein [Acidimicrobiia bacterium]
MSSRHRERRRPAAPLLLVALLAVLLVALLAAACGNAKSDKSSGTSTTTGSVATKVDAADLRVHHSVDETGVTDGEIRVSVIAAITNPLGIDFGAFGNGIKAYLDMVNSGGGLYGRQLKVAAVHDDQLSNNTNAVEAALAQDNAFSVFVATSLFTGASVLAAQKVPTFGWNVNTEWTGHDTFFPNWPAYCFSCAAPFAPYLAQQTHARRIGIVAYSVPQAADCANWNEVSLEKWPTGKIVFSDKSIPFGVADVSAQVAQLRDRHVQLLLTCMDANGAFTFAKEMQKDGVNIPMLVPNSYDHAFMKANGKYFEGSYVSVQVTPLETRPQPAEMNKMLSWVAKTKQPVTELTMQGWIAANQFVTGVKLAGPDFNRAKVVAALNAQTHFTANGMVRPLDWTRDHISAKDRPNDTVGLDCLVILKVHDNAFVSSFGAPADKPWPCWTVASEGRGSSAPVPLPAPTYSSFVPTSG